MGKRELEARHEIHKHELAQIRNPVALTKVKKLVGTGTVTFIERRLFESDAFLALGGVAPQLLIYLLGKRQFEKIGKNTKKRVCVNCDELTLPIVELQKLGITQPRGTRGIDDLLAKGFIEIEHHGGAYKKDKSIYSLSEKWIFWQPGTVFFERPPRIKRGFQGGTKLPKKRFQHTKS